MLKQFLGSVLTAAVVFIAPLLGAPDRLLHPAPWVGLVMSIITLMTQPAIGLSDMVRDRTDRFSAAAIFLGVIAAQLASVLEFGYRADLRPPPASLVFGAGLCVAIGGLALRLWAIRTLGRFFTSTVHVEGGQTVVQTGPYSVLRHPSYTGTLLTSLGLAMTMASTIGVALTALLALPAYIYRIQVEEKALAVRLGDAYRAYSTRTARLVPYVY